MTKITILSGFLGAGKTTLIRKLLAEVYKGEQVVLIENEFGEIGIDGGFLQDAGVTLREMNSGCICCTLSGDFEAALAQVLDTYAPDRIIIEPSGVGKLSDVLAAVRRLHIPVELSGCAAVADATKCRLYLKNFGEFYKDQIANASAVILSRTAGMDADKLAAAVALLRDENADAPIVTTPWNDLNGAQLADAMEQRETLTHTLHALEEEAAHAHHDCGHGHGHAHADEHEHEQAHHHHHGHAHGGHTCNCDATEHHHGHTHDHGHEDEPRHDCHHAHDGHTCGCGAHEEHTGECGCGRHHHDHEHGHDHGHHADEVFQSFGVETTRSYTGAELEAILCALDQGEGGTVLRAKGIVPAADGTWLHFDYVPQEHNIRTGSAAVTGRLCVIGAHLNENALRALLHVSSADRAVQS